MEVGLERKDGRDPVLDVPLSPEVPAGLVGEPVGAVEGIEDQFPPQGLIETAKGGTAISGDEGGGIQAGLLVAPTLHQGQTHQRLGPGQVNAPGLKGVFVVQRYRRQRHCELPGLRNTTASSTQTS